MYLPLSQFHLWMWLWDILVLRTLGTWILRTLGPLDSRTLGLLDLFPPPPPPHNSSYLLLLPTSSYLLLPYTTTSYFLISTTNITSGSFSYSWTLYWCYKVGELSCNDGSGDIICLACCHCNICRIFDILEELSSTLRRRKVIFL